MGVGGWSTGRRSGGRCSIRLPDLSCSRCWRRRSGSWPRRATRCPAEAIQRLLTERPDVIGLALPGMPADSPGMGGDTDDWTNQPVVLVNTDASLSDWNW